MAPLDKSSCTTNEKNPRDAHLTPRLGAETVQHDAGALRLKKKYTTVQPKCTDLNVAFYARKPGRDRHLGSSSLDSRTK